MRMKRIAVFLVVILLTSICTAGVALANTQNSDKTWRSPKYGGTLTLVTVDEPTTMDTLQVTTGMYDHMYISEPPVMVTPEGNYERAGWLKSFSMSPDEKTWTFQIKKGVKFHDGTKLDAEAFAWILKKRKKDKDIYSTPLWTVPAENITVLDEYTLQLKQTNPNPNLYASFSSPVWLGGMRTPKAVEKYGKDYGSAEAYGNGPFKFVEWVKGDYMKLTRNEDYDWAPTFINHQGPPYLKNVVIKYVSEKTTQIQMLKAGKADALLDVPPMYADQLKKNEDINVSTIPTTNLYTVEYNVEN
ncbi:MAG: ABC transporter substrate-binding protein, partial [Candidatus Bipolaricaulia bacterium]